VAIVGRWDIATFKLVVSIHIAFQVKLFGSCELLVLVGCI
jgi:hypothetical protein